MNDGLGHTYIASIFENQAGELCVVSGALVFNRFNGERFTTLRLNVPDPIASLSWFRTAFQDHAGEWWVTTRKGLYRFPRVQRVEELARTRPKAVYTTRDGLADNALSRLYEDARGDIWIGTHAPARHALTRWERTSGAFHRYAEADGLPSPNAAVSFCEDRADNLWVGFSEGGLARYRGGRFMLLRAADGLPAGEIAALYLDHAGRLWVGSSRGGLGRVDDPTAERPRVVTYTTAEGLTSHNVRCLTEDQWGRLYIGTISGVDRLDPATGRIKHYTKADGLAGELTAAFRDRYHALWFGAWDGLSRLIPEPDPPVLPPPVFIGRLHIAGVSYPISALGEAEVAKLELTASQNHVQIDFFGLGFGLGEALRYQYRMEGMDKDWGPPTDQRSVHYLRLPPGAYRFAVRAVNTDGLVSETPAVVSFTILPPIWRSWWFIMLVVLGMSLLVYALYRYRVARLIELERVRTRIATDLHDDVGSSLSQVAILGEVAQQQIREAPLGAAATVAEITETARALIDAMSDIVWSIDPRRDDLSNLVIRIRKFTTNLFEGQGIAWDFKTPSELENIKLTPEQRRHLFLIFKEAIHNIVRHAGATAVTLHLAVADHQLTAELRDNGRGFTLPLGQESAKPERQGYGLSSMQARAAQLGGHLTVDAAPGHGMRLTLRVPLKG